MTNFGNKPEQEISENIGVNYVEHLLTRITTLEAERDNLARLLKEGSELVNEYAAENARLTAAHAMQGESLVVLPRHMVNSIEEQLKDYKAAARNLAKHLEAINNICERGDEFIPTEVVRSIRKHCEAANVMDEILAAPHKFKTDPSIIVAIPSELKAAIEDIKYYVGNPSAWEYYDDGVSEKIRTILKAAGMA